ncbi:OLC1v1012259C1 [Oldenlandia corymbosa var. corymbosa]|uniref:OLC1v1012259C1 n=1 Tax=Oldenlandia corymbosa var. corymbosa TaxID=529605 RepID=A0AAV1DVK6_OLDCO|nr:OLC1v1012259C1 [Oldenlandia corymbosa var. corymbosa]
MSEVSSTVPPNSQSANNSTAAPSLNLQLSLQPMNHSFTVKLQSRANYPVSRLQITPLLNMFKLFGIVDGLEPASPHFLPPASEAPSQPNHAFDVWHQKDQMVFSWILFFVTDEIFPAIQGATTSAAAWSAIQKGYGTLSYTHQTPLMLEFHTLQKGDQSMSSLLHKAKGTVDSLNLTGHQISVAEFNAIIFRKLGSEFNGIIGALQ